MKVKDCVYNVGVNDREIELFEGQYVVEKGMAYNSYLIADEKIAVIDSVEKSFKDEWLDNIQSVIGAKSPDYLVIQHMEPDHSANIAEFMKVFDKTVIVANSKVFTMLNNYFGVDFADRRIVINEGDTLSLGKRTLRFIFAPMVHWPEVTLTYDEYDKILFSADAFGKFGTTDADEDWACEARRYYFGIVGKYGMQVQATLKKAAALEIEAICPLHGYPLTEDLGYYLNLYNIWSSYGVESEGIVICYMSVYGHTKDAVMLLAQKLKEKGCPKVSLFDLARDDMAEAVEDAFRYGKIVLATTTYNADIFPFMREFINHLTERNYQNRTIGLIENGSWAPVAAKVMKEMFAKCKNLTFTENTVKIVSALNNESREQVNALADELCKDYKENKKANDSKSLFNIGYGLYVITTNDGVKDNGCIINAANQVSISPDRIALSINKLNYTHHVLKTTGKANLNCLSEKAPFDIFKNFGFKSGRNSNKFDNFSTAFSRSANGLVVLSEYINAYISLNVDEYVDLGSHGLFVCSIEQSEVINDDATMTYVFYQKNVRPKPQKPETQKTAYVCKICGYVYEGETLPDDYVCPVCKHPASDFEKIK